MALRDSSVKHIETTIFLSECENIMREAWEEHGTTVARTFKIIGRSGVKVFPVLDQSHVPPTPVASLGLQRKD